MYKHVDMSNVEDRAFSIMVPLRILRKLDPVLYVWIYSEYKGVEKKVVAGLAYDHHISQVIEDVLLHSNFLCNYRDIPGEFQMTTTAYLVDINRDNVGYIYDRLYRQV